MNQTQTEQPQQIKQFTLVTEQSAKQQSPKEIKLTKLNWTKMLFDYHIILDAQAFEKWDGKSTIDGLEILEKDLPRTRYDSPQMKKPQFKNALRRITTFYCIQNGVAYQQGLLEVVYPFALLRRKDFKTKKCYAYFNAFMRKHFPKVLVQRVVEGKKQLPHAILAITLTQCLLSFHYPKISKCLKQYQIPMSLVITKQLLTIFAKNLPIQFVYQIYDYFIRQNDVNNIFYMAVAMLGKQQQTILKSALDDKIHQKIQDIKKVDSEEELQKWFQLTEEIKKNTPSSFISISNQFCFIHRNLLSTEDVDKMIKSPELVGGYLPISIEQINKNISKYTILLLQTQSLHNIHNYSTIRINPEKQPNEQNFPVDKIYVLAAHEQHLQRQTEILLKYASKLPNNRFLMLTQHLVNHKSQICEIF